MASIRIESIVIGERFRKDMGDIAALAESIKEHGLLHPVVLTPERQLICGHRRIEATRALGWQEIPFREVSVANLLKAERDENEVRKDLLPSEKIAIGRLIEAQEKPKARERQGHRTDIEELKLGRKLPRGSAKTVDIVSAAVGMSPKTYDRAKKVLHAAELDPEKYGDLPGSMDETGNIHGTFQELKRRQTGNGRHPMHRKKHHPKAVKMIRRAINQLCGCATALGSIESLSNVEPALRVSLSEEMVIPITNIRSFARRLKNGS